MIDIDFLYKSGFISNLDYYCSLILCRTAKENDPVILLSVAFTSMASIRGNVCLDIDEFAGKTLSWNDSVSPESGHSCLKFPEKNNWIESIENSSIIGKSTEYPLVFDGKSRLYLARYYDFQQRIVENIIQRMQKKPDDVDVNILNQGLDRLFPCAQSSDFQEPVTENHEIKKIKNSFEKKSGIEAIDMMDEGIRIQRQAAMNAVLRKFTIISGGPGTGKTFICEKIIELLNDQADAASLPHPGIIAVAPTGKAASKLKNGLTIHRMLGASNRSNQFLHSKETPIQCDVVIIDEASMIDIALMARLLEAVPDNARLIMLGDKNQLASVEAGAVFGDICRSKLMSDVLTDLKYNFRSNGNSGIDKLAKAVNSGDTLEVEKLLLNNCHGADPDLPGFASQQKMKVTRSFCKDFLIKKEDDICFVETNNEANGRIKDEIVKEYLQFMKEDDPETALEQFAKFRILCAHRKGYYGTEYFNAMTESLLRSLIKDDFYKKPVMVNVNDYYKNLFNGDTGIVVKTKDGTAKVFIKKEIEKKRINNYKKDKKDIGNSGQESSGNASTVLTSFLFSDFPPHEDAFAITVHKSQGSEFDHVLLVIPDILTPVVTRELLYTGITRAKQKLTIAGNIEVIKEAVSLSVHRNSAITELIDSYGIKSLSFF